MGSGVLIGNTIQDCAGSGADGLTKNGDGTLTLTGNNTFTGPLRHNSGTLILGNDAAAGQGTLIFGNGFTV
jgi:fibronectin-binding autotransporter adhesin